MGAKKILEQLESNDVNLKIGKENVVVEVKQQDVKKGIPTDELFEELKKAAKENLLSYLNLFF